MWRVGPLMMHLPDSIDEIIQCLKLLEIFQIYFSPAENIIQIFFF